MFGVILLAMLFAALPWAWVDLFPTIPLGVRPAMLAAVPLLGYWTWSKRHRFLAPPSRSVALLLALFLILLLPSLTYEHPHWSLTRLLAFFVLGVMGYIVANVYLRLHANGILRKYWPLIGFSFLFSAAGSFYMAFGGLFLDSNMFTSISSSRSFIHGSLYAHIFSDPEAAKGIRHTMVMALTVLMALIFHNSLEHRWTSAILTIPTLYLVFFSFSRSAWLAAFLIVVVTIAFLLVGVATSKTRVAITKIALTVIVCVAVLWVFYSESISQGINLLVDRIIDERSAEGRMHASKISIEASTTSELFIGINRMEQVSPHNFPLDALMQAGLPGGLAALVVVVFALYLYGRCFVGSNLHAFFIAAFVTPALVRMFSAGGGLIHLSELVSMFIAFQLYWYEQKIRRQRHMEKQSAYSMLRISAAHLNPRR